MSDGWVNVCSKRTLLIQTTAQILSGLVDHYGHDHPRSLAELALRMARAVIDVVDEDAERERITL